MRRWRGKARGAAVDPLAEVMATAGSGGVSGRFVEARAPWGLRLGGAGRPTFAAVVEGTCWMHRRTGPPIRLTAGDFALTRAAGPDDGLASSPDDDVLAGHEPPPTDTDGKGAGECARSVLEVVEIPGEGPATSVVCGCYSADADAHPILRTLPPLVHVRASDRKGRGILDESLRLLAVELRRDSPGARIVRDRLMDVIFIHGLRAWLGSVADDDPVPSQALPTDPVVTTAIACVQADPARAWTARALAAEVGLSRAAFTRRFTACVGEPPVAYVTKWRLTSAAHRLRETDESLAAIARGIGYSSEFTFSRAFARLFGQPPGRYRAENETIGETFAPLGYGASEPSSLT